MRSLVCEAHPFDSIFGLDKIERMRLPITINTRVVLGVLLMLLAVFPAQLGVLALAAAARNGGGGLWICLFVFVLVEALSCVTLFAGMHLLVHKPPHKTPVPSSTRVL